MSISSSGVSTSSLGPSGRGLGAVVEPAPADYPLLSLPNVVATPHAAAGTHATQVRSALQVAQQVVDVLNGQEPPNRVV